MRVSSRGGGVLRCIRLACRAGCRRLVGCVACRGAAAWHATAPAQPHRLSRRRRSPSCGGGTVADIRIEGIAADRAGNGPLLSADPAGRRLGRRAGRQLAEGAVRDRAVRRRKSEPRRQYPGRQGGREPDHQPHRLRGKLARSTTRISTPKSSCARASSIPAPGCRTTSSASSTSIAGTAGSRATVEPKVIQLSENRVDLVFEINEGEFTGVRSINFVGNRQFSDGKLRGVIETKESRWYRFLSTDDTYDPDRLTYDRELLRKFYLSEGYADFRVVSAVAELTPDRDGFIITFTIDEGERYRFGKIDVDIKLKDLPARSGAAAADRPHRRLVQCRRGRTIDRGADRRARQPRLRLRRGQAEHHPQPRRAHRRHHLQRPGGAAGLCRADRHRRQRPHARQGDPPRVSAWSRATRSTPPRCSARKERIKNLGFFKKVEVTNSPGSAPDRTVVTVEVEEQSTGELSLGLGFSTTRRPARRHQYPRAQFSRPRPGSADRHRGFAALATGRSQLHRAVFPRHATSPPASTCSKSRPARPPISLAA